MAKHSGGAHDAARLRRVRDAMAFSQRELATSLGVAAGSVAQWESGARAVPGPVVNLIAAYEHELGLRSGAAVVERSRFLPRTIEHASVMVLFGISIAAGKLEGSAIARIVRQAAVRQYVKQLSEMKGLAMKLAQASTYLDMLLSSEERSELREAQRHSACMDERAVRELFIDELGRAPGRVFASWTARPAAVASIGQVHRAQLPSGEAVAVKVQYRQSVARIASDLRTIRRLERPISLLWRSQDPKVLLDELRELVMRECDYRVEASNQARFRSAFASCTDLIVPEVFPSYSSERVLTSTWVDGETLERFAAHATQAQRNRAATTLWAYFQESILRYRMLNTDTHPGNFLFVGDRVALLDFGRVKHFDDAFCTDAACMLRSLLERDLPAYRRAILSLGFVPRPATFDFEYSFRAMQYFVLPSLSDKPFTFTPQYVRQMWAMFSEHNVNRDRLNYSAEALFFGQYFFGVAAILTELRGTVACRQVVLDLLYPGDTRRPRPHSEAEIAALPVLGALTS